MKRTLIAAMVAVGLLCGCVTAPEVVKAPALPEAGSTKQAVVKCEGKWQSITVPACFPDNLTGIQPVSKTELTFTGAFDTPCGYAFAWMDMRPGICGDRLMIGFAVGEEYWINRKGVPTSATAEEFAKHLTDYEAKYSTGKGDDDETFS